MVKEHKWKKKEICYSSFFLRRYYLYICHLTVLILFSTILKASYYLFFLNSLNTVSAGHNVFYNDKIDFILYKIHLKF